MPATVRFHPDGGLFVGDQVSIEAILPGQQETGNSPERVSVTHSDGNPLAYGEFRGCGLGGRFQATMIWAWDTDGYEPGDYALTFTLEPEGMVWTETVTLLPQSALPSPEPEARWKTARSMYCTLHYITGTAAERDLPQLLREADEQARDAVNRMGVEFTDPITITLLSRVLGHGGFAGDEISISYLDRNYAGSNFGLVLHHEMIHILDARLGGDFRPSLFVEGLAVYQSGGHFKPEALMPRAAALLPTEIGLGWYIPLAELADNFYLSQHEIGYLEGASLVEYMVNTWGWEVFSSFYRDIHLTEDNLHSSAIDAALQKHFNLTFSELEAKFIEALQHIPITNEIRNDIRLTVEYYDTLRRYQQILDPSAFFQAAWLLDVKSMRQRSIVADYLRHPATAENLALEAIFVNAFEDLRLGQFTAVTQKLDIANAVLFALERGDERPFELNDQVSDYYAIVQTLSQAGYEAQRLDVEGENARAWVTADSTNLIELTLMRGDEGWELMTSSGNIFGLEFYLPVMVFDRR